jgi:hypothetical protein
MGPELGSDYDGGWDQRGTRRPQNGTRGRPTETTRYETRGVRKGTDMLGDESREFRTLDRRGRLGPEGI